MVARSIKCVLPGVLVCSALFAACGGSHGGAAAPTPSGEGGTTKPVGTGDEYMAPPGPPLIDGVPNLPVLQHVKANVHGTSAEITFDPFPGAKDYRVYVKPADKSTVRLASDGSLDGYENAMYRCAGGQAAPGVWVDFDPGPPTEGQSDGVPNWISVSTTVESNSAKGQHDVHGYTRTAADSTLGQVFLDQVDGTVPIYALGDPDPLSDNYAYGARVTQTRAKIYTADRGQYVASGFRDDGVAFYAPPTDSSKACGSDKPVPVYQKDFSDSGSLAHVFYAEGPEADARGKGTPVFYVCPNKLDKSKPLMRVYYTLASPGGNFGNFDQSGHDELVVGEERFERARCQGSTFGPCATASQSRWGVHWSNITGPVSLVVEALDAGCPFQGLLGHTSLQSLLVDSGDNNGDSTLMSDRVFTFDELRAAAPHGEVFLNGQWDAASKPHAIARALVDVSPQTRPQMEFQSDFAGNPEDFTELFESDGTTPKCGLTQELVKQANSNDPQCDGAHQFTSPTYQVLLQSVQNERYSVGIVNGELWTGYSGGKFRITPQGKTATFSDTTYLHAAMEVSSFTTGRRYPQIMISTQDMMTAQFLLDRTNDQKNTNIQPVIVMNPFDSGVGRHIVEIELCNTRPWQVNNHCPWFLLEAQDRTDKSKLGKWSPHPDPLDRFQDDKGVRYDLYVNTKKAYLFLDSQPYGCVDIEHRTTTDFGGATIDPQPAPPQPGPVNVTFGDVLYHAGAEAGYFQIYSPYHLKHLMYETTRHFDYIAYNSGEPAPGWDEKAIPCVTQMHNGGGAGTQTPEQ
ncbi:MAG TPA: hypothetical protein VHE30_29325 [Polyangiaceae bacterium]|nr:hypothetical protein [Polyangiaceae bacterium]